MSERLVIRTTGQTGPSGGGGGGGAASDITFSPTGTIAATNVQAAIAEVATDAAAAYQPLDSDLTAIAALSTTSYGRAFLALADAAALRTAGGLVIGTDVAAQSSLASYLTTAAAASGYQPLDSDLTAIAALSTTSYGRAFLTLANQAALMALLSAASDTASGIVELATTAETTTGTDTGRAVTPAGLLNATTASNINGRVGVELAGSLVGRRRNINFIQGSNVTLTVTDDAGNEEVDVEIAASGGGSSQTFSRESIIAGTTHYTLPGVMFTSTYPSVVLAANTVYYQSWYLPSSITFDRIATYINASVPSGQIRLGIYNAAANGAPTTLVVDSGVIDTSTGGVKEATVSSTTIGPGMFCLATASNSGTHSIITLVSPATHIRVSNGYDVVREASASFTFGALPGTATTPTSFLWGDGTRRFYGYLRLTS
jgi:hypothetical protein